MNINSEHTNKSPGVGRSKRKLCRTTCCNSHQLIIFLQLSLLLQTIQVVQWSSIVSNAFQHQHITPLRHHDTYQFYQQTFKSSIKGQQKYQTRETPTPILKQDHHYFGIFPQQRCLLQSKFSLNMNAESTETFHDTESKVSDIPMPTKAGGYTHTEASRAKISAANKGKTPWNKGKARSEEVKARIAEGVRRKNRERFLKKLEDLGVTEEEYEQQKKEERRKKDAERRARKTANGGYRLTEETKKKISIKLKEKHAKGEVKKREYSGPFRKGFSHSPETKQKIREALTKKWAEDLEYQEKMRESSKNNNNVSSRAKISKTLKEKWQDPAFREKMTKAMNKRKKSSPASQSQKAKISAAMKKKWKDKEYRNKAIKGMTEYRESLPPKPKKFVPKAVSTIKIDDVYAVSPIKKGAKTKRKRKSSVKVASTNANSVKKKKATKTKKKKKKKATLSLVQSETAIAKPISERTKGKKAKKDDGDISRMREERRDLYDLLYGDEPQNIDILSEEDSFEPVIPDQMSETENSAMDYFGGGVDSLDDENLDDFDPYGLDDQ